jgi:hypothetical protein
MRYTPIYVLISKFVHEELAHLSVCGFGPDRKELIESDAFKKYFNSDAVIVRGKDDTNIDTNNTKLGINIGADLCQLTPNSSIIIKKNCRINLAYSKIGALKNYLDYTNATSFLSHGRKEMMDILCDSNCFVAVCDNPITYPDLHYSFTALDNFLFTYDFEKEDEFYVSQILYIKSREGKK